MATQGEAERVGRARVNEDRPFGGDWDEDEGVGGFCSSRRDGRTGSRDEAEEGRPETKAEVAGGGGGS